MIQFILALLFSLLFGTPVATKSQWPDKPLFEPVPGRLYLVRPKEWGGSGSGMAHPAVVLGPDPLTRGWGTIIVEISHTSIASRSENANRFYPKGTEIPASRCGAATKIDERSMINVADARVVPTLEQVFKPYMKNLDMARKYVDAIKESIERHGNMQSRPPSLFKDRPVYGMGTFYPYSDKDTFVLPERIRKRLFRKTRYAKSSCNVSTLPCTDRKRGRQQEPSCAAPKSPAHAAENNPKRSGVIQPSSNKSWASVVKDSLAHTAENKPNKLKKSWASVVKSGTGEERK